VCHESLSVLIATADLASSMESRRWWSARAKGHPGQGGQDRLGPWTVGLPSTTHPLVQPPRAWSGQAVPDAPASETASEERREAGTGTVRTGGLATRAPVGGNATSRYEAVHVWMVGQGAGPGVPDDKTPLRPPTSCGVRGKSEEHWAAARARCSYEVSWIAPELSPSAWGTEDTCTEGTGRRSGRRAASQASVSRRGPLGPLRFAQAWSTSAQAHTGRDGHRCPTEAALRQWTRSSRARRWLGRRPSPTRARAAGQSAGRRLPPLA